MEPPRRMDEQKYVSPSDGIQSPATQKLAAFKNKHGLQKYVSLDRPLRVPGPNRSRAGPSPRLSSAR